MTGTARVLSDAVVPGTQPESGAADDSFAHALGSVIRARRRAQSMTLVQVATATGLSHPFLSQLERGLARPSMRSLHLIAKSLQTTQQHLIGEAAGSPAADEIVRHDQGQELIAEGGGARLLMSQENAADVTEFVLFPDRPSGYYTHDTHEMVYVVSGTVEIEIDDPTADGGSRTERLEARDTMGYDGRLQHRHTAIGGPAVTLVIHTPIG